MTGAEPAAPRTRLHREAHRPGAEVPVFVNEPWERRFRGLAAGITAAGADFGLTSNAAAWTVLERLEALAAALGFPATVLGRQVHGDHLEVLDPAPRSGVLVPGERDGLIAMRGPALLVVTVADCVPVSLIHPSGGVIGLLHAGWRGAAAGILERGVETLSRRFAARPEELLMHLGPAICGDCYEVGPEVPRALGREPEASGTLDLREELVRRARGCGLRPDRTTRSPWCTRCHSDHFHSYRGMGDDAGRMAAYLGWRGAVPASDPR